MRLLRRPLVDAQVEVAGRDEPVVAQYLLDVADRAAVEEERRGHRVPEHVRRHGLREADRPAEAPEPGVGALELQRLVKVCADPACRVHHPNTPSPQQVERERAEERKRIEKEKLAITTRHCILATILQRASAPLKKADLLAVAHYLIAHLSYSQVPALAKRHKVEAKKDSACAQELLAKQVVTYDESELCKLLLEVSLLDSA